MTYTFVRGSLAALATAALAACTVTAPAPGASQAEASASAPSSDSWLQGSVEQRLDTLAEQLRGFGVTMVEVDHRYRELYFAGQDGNWDYAAYQVEEIEEAIESGLQRRPKRAAAAAMLEPALEAVEAAASARDSDAFEKAFTTLTATCNACHQAEGVSFVQVAVPRQRVSSVRSTPATD